MKKFDAIKIPFDKITCFELSHFVTLCFLIMVLLIAQIVNAQGNQFVLQLLLNPSDTLHTQCRHMKHLHEELLCHKNTVLQNYSVLNFFGTLLLNIDFFSAQCMMHGETNLYQSFC